MKRKRIVLAAVIMMSILTGYGGIQIKNAAMKSDTDRKNTLKAAPDFTLEFPSDWENNYETEASGDMGHGSYVAFYAKKCHRETGEGWLFSIARYQDDSYTEMPSYELVGMWDGVRYVAVFPTDVQFDGATEEAVKQYQKLTQSVEDTVRSIEND